MSIIRIKKQGGYEVIPNAFANDTRLSVDAAAVGLWLAAKSKDFQVRPRSIQFEFSKRGKKCGEEWWSRVARELKQSGYMRLTRWKDPAGKFCAGWDFSVHGLDNDEQQEITDPGSAGGGSAGGGSAGGGSADTGSAQASSQYQGSQYKGSQYKDTTTTTAAAASEAEPKGLVIEVEIIGYSNELKNALAGLPRPLAQEIVDELAGVVQAAKNGKRKPIENPIRWIEAVKVRAKKGQFFLSTAGKNIQARRSRIAQDNLARAASMTQPPSGERKTMPSEAMRELQKYRKN